MTTKDWKDDIKENLVLRTLIRRDDAIDYALGLAEKHFSRLEAEKNLQLKKDAEKK